MKKILGYGIIILLCVFLVGCGNETTEENNDSNTTNNTDNSELDSTEDENDGKWISTDDKLIFIDDDGYYMVFTYDGEVLSKVEWVMDFEDDATAQMAYDLYTSGYDTMYDVAIDDTVVTLTLTDDYAQATYGTISKSDMETYMENAGYIINEG